MGNDEKPMDNEGVWIHARPQCDGVGLSIFTYTDGGTMFAVKSPPVLEQINPSSELAPPAILLAPPAARMLMDTLWRCGVRPTEGLVSEQILQIARAFSKEDAK